MKVADFKNELLTDRIELDADGESVWIEYQSTQSVDFIKAKNSYQQSLSKLFIAGKEPIKKKIVLGQEISESSEDNQKLTAIMMASLVTDWGFDERPTLDNVATFLYSNFEVLDEISIKSGMLKAREVEAKKKLLPQPKESSDS